MSYGHEHPSTAPVAMDAPGSRAKPTVQTRQKRTTGQTVKLRPKRTLAGMTGYLVAGIFLGLVLIFAMSIGRGGDAAAAVNLPSAVTDNVVRLHSADIGNSCWQGISREGPARLTVALEVGVDGKIRYAAASGESPSMRGCVEAYVKAWEFLPQSQAQTMALPFEVDRR